MIYFVSDLHLKHVGKNGGGIIEFERTNFNSIEEHDAFIKYVIFSTMKSTDELWILGDIGADYEWIKDVKGKKYLIMGNHDRGTKTAYRKVFDEVYDHPVWFSRRILLSHYPERVDSDVINVHGHLHNSKLDLPNYINVNIQNLNYKLLSLKQVNNLMGSIAVDTLKYKFGSEWWIDRQVYDDSMPEKYKPPLKEDGKHVDGRKLRELRREKENEQRN